ncbi:Hypothetical protein GbCGDNIH9_8567 [Granulibacter bethesdensis]|uniref:Uncharacterized protein n=1 Tax=Granulibacter bethesdensis TaxID=364410 RepID=A0AAC9K7S7_9PROT|nr:Hypothetical protein GbCGDNIH9_8567 [Granulibacter bethesdensis]APH62287.1 Hypothetical protein GbCGDNIH8_8567 [Granulibacter bethesdensis]
MITKTLEIFLYRKMISLLKHTKADEPEEGVSIDACATYSLAAGSYPDPDRPDRTSGSPLF